MTDPVVSVLLPARNAERTLAEALEGLFAQRGAPPFEIVCVDDGSTDATGLLLHEAARRDDRLRVVRGEGLGLVAALGLGLSHCRGRYVARMDADDRVHPDRLGLQAALLDGDPSLGAVGSDVLIFPWPLSPGLFRLQEWLNSLRTGADLLRERFIDVPLVHPSWMLRRSALDAVGGYQDRGWPEDWDLLLRLAAGGFTLGKVPRTLLWWRDSAGRLTRTHAAYSPDALRSLRAHHLASGPLRSRPCEIWGAGPTGKRLARALEAEGVRVRRFIDVSGQTEARGAPVVGPGALGPPTDALLVVAVGAAGARETIRAALGGAGWAEGTDYLCAA